MRHGRLITAALFVGLAAAAGGCGSSGPSKTEFAKLADALCRRANRTAPQRPPRTAKEAVGYTQTQIGDRTALDARLRRLSVPDSSKSDFSAYNARTAAMIGLLRQQNSAARRGDESGYDRLQLRFTTIAGERERLAVKLGFNVCGRSGPTGTGGK